MRILILGGTRFLGQQVAKLLVLAGHELTLISRRLEGAPVEARHICEERTSGLKTLQGEHYDLVIDFICYDEQNIEELAASITVKNYILVSSAWVPRLWSGSSATELPSLTVRPSQELSNLTQNYLSGKLRAEQALTKLRQLGSTAVSLRLPIILGDRDHTGRLDFYRQRLADSGPLILVDGGHNRAQIVLMEYLAQAIVCWSTKTDISLFQVWEALPDTGRSVRQIIIAMAASLGVVAKLVDVSVAELAKDLPLYLDKEPFWRETSLPLTLANIFSSLDLPPVLFSEHISMTIYNDDPTAGLRRKELQLIANRCHD